MRVEKSAILNTRVNPEVKKSAEEVLSQLGIPMATAIDMFLRQISHTQSIPFPVALPRATSRVDATRMDADRIRGKISDGLENIEQSKVRSMREALDCPNESSKQ